MKKKRWTEEELLENILKNGIVENVNGFELEKIKCLESIAKTAKDPEIRKRAEEEAQKIRESVEFKEYENEKRIAKMNEDFN